MLHLVIQLRSLLAQEEWQVVESCVASVCVEDTLGCEEVSSVPRVGEGSAASSPAPSLSPAVLPCLSSFQLSSETRANATAINASARST